MLKSSNLCKGRDIMTKRMNKLHGFTLIELIVVIAIIAILAAMLVPTLSGYVQRAKVAAAISSAKTIKSSVESSLSARYSDYAEAGELGDALNKILYLDQKKDVSQREFEIVGAFTNRSWWTYMNGNRSGSKSQQVDTVIAKGLAETFNEKWEKGKGNNPLAYGKNGTCRDFLKSNNCNVGLVVVYDADCSVRMLQLYRRGILVTYVNGEYIANTSKDARFVGTNVWSSIYSGSGSKASEELYRISLADKQIGDNGKQGGWY